MGATSPWRNASTGSSASRVRRSARRMVPRRRPSRSTTISRLVAGGISPSRRRYRCTTSTVTSARTLIASRFMSPPALSSGKARARASRSRSCAAMASRTSSITSSGSSWRMSTTSSSSRWAARAASSSGRMVRRRPARTASSISASTAWRRAGSMQLQAASRSRAGRDSNQSAASAGWSSFSASRRGPTAPCSSSSVNRSWRGTGRARSPSRRLSFMFSPGDLRRVRF